MLTRKKYRKRQKKIPKQWKLSIKRMVKNQLTWLTDGFTKFQNDFVLYCYSNTTPNYVPANVIKPTLPTIYHGCKGLFDVQIDGFASLNTDLTSALKNAPVPAAPDYASDSVTLHKKNRFLQFAFHNPMTEIVMCTVWILTLKDNLNSVENYGPVANWKEAYEQDRNFGASNDFYQDYWDYPTNYAMFRNVYDMRHKKKMVLQPGETMMMESKLPNIIFRGSDYDAITGPTQLNGGRTFYIMIETKGVPTHLSTSTDEKCGTIGFTASGVEALARYSYQYGVTAQDAGRYIKISRNYANELTLTGAHSLIPDNDATIKPV